MISEDRVCPWLKRLRTPGPGAEGWGAQDGSPRAVHSAGALTPSTRTARGRRHRAPKAWAVA